MVPREDLLQKYLEGQCSREEAEELLQWLRSSEANRALLAKMQAEFERSMNTPVEMPAGVSDRIENRLLQDISGTKLVRIRARRRNWMAAAAVTLLIVATGFYFLRNNPSSKTPAGQTVQNITDIAPGQNKAILTLSNGDTVELDSTGNQVIKQGSLTAHQANGQLQYDGHADHGAVGYNILTVPRGGQFHVVLPDGSKVWLNSASSLKYPTAFTGKERSVELQGQGYFEVTKNAQQPFSVKAGAMEVHVLGTSFDVMAYSDEASINTTLVDGAVKVKGQVLKPGQQARFDPATGDVTVAIADVQQVIAWKTGFFEFDNARLADIMRQVARWYDIDVSYTNEQATGTYGGRISRNLPLSEILHMLEPNGAAFILEGRKLKVSSTR